MLRISSDMFCLVSHSDVKLNFQNGNFSETEYTLTCRLRASLVSLWFGHARGKTTLSCFLTLSRRFATRSAWRMRTQRHSSPVEIPRTSHQKKNHQIRVWIRWFLVSQSQAKSNLIYEFTSNHFLQVTGKVAH